MKKLERPPTDQLVEEGNQENKEEKLFPVLQEIKDMELNLSEEEFKEAVYGETTISRETSEEAFLRIAKQLINGEKPSANSFGAMLRILERDSMKGHPKMELFKTAIQKLAEQNKHELKVREGYWDELK